MAMCDVKKYMKQVSDVRQEAKNDLVDFEEALKDGHITEDRLTEIKEDFDRIDQNYQRLLYIMWLFSIPNRRSKRLLYIMWLFSIPNRRSKRARYDKESRGLIEKFSLTCSDSESVLAESYDALKDMREQIKQLKKQE